MLTNVPGPIIAEQTSPAGTPVTVPLPSATDNCGSVVVVSDAPAVFPPGPTTVTFTATDLEGITATATTTVTVQDTIPPTTVKAVSDGDGDGVLDSQTITLTATDGGSGVASVSFSIDGGTVTTVAGSSTNVPFPVGTHTLSFFATDKANNVEPTQTQPHTFPDNCPRRCPHQWRPH